MRGAKLSSLIIHESGRTLRDYFCFQFQSSHLSDPQQLTDFCLSLGFELRNFILVTKTNKKHTTNIWLQLSWLRLTLLHRTLLVKHHANTDQMARAPFHWSECVCAFRLYIYSVCVAYCPSVGAPADTMSVFHDSHTPSPSSWRLTAGFLDPSISVSERGKHESRGSRCEAENKTHLFLPSEANQSPNRWLAWVIRTTKYSGGTEDEELC